MPTLDRPTNYYVDTGLCECDVIQDTEASPAWSMGPGSCEDRALVEQCGRQFLISTYSNLYNPENKVVQCGADTLWAWCYGAPCVVDEEDPTKALCTCPLVQSPTKLLISDCSDTDYCGEIWSAAVPPGDCFANCRYYDELTRMGLPVAPVADLCTGGPVCECPTPPGRSEESGAEGWRCGSAARIAAEPLERGGVRGPRGSGSRAEEAPGANLAIPAGSNVH